MGKKFSDYYAEDLTATKRISPKPPVEEEIVQVETEVVKEEAQAPIPNNDHVIKEALERATSLNEELVQQFNTTIQTLTEQNNETNQVLVEAIRALTDKIGLLEDRIESLKNLEIPTPVVNVTMPEKKVVKKVHRDNRGYVTHVTEEEVYGEDEEDNER